MDENKSLSYDKLVDSLKTSGVIGNDKSSATELIDSADKLYTAWQEHQPEQLIPCASPHFLTPFIKAVQVNQAAELNLKYSLKLLPIMFTPILLIEKLESSNQYCCAT